MRRNVETQGVDDSGFHHSTEGDQLPNFLDEYEKICKDLNKDLPAESIIEDDSLDGRITLSPKGVHFDVTRYGFTDEHGFWEDFINSISARISGCS